jgi:hypothetical protein
MALYFCKYLYIYIIKKKPVGASPAVSLRKGFCGGDERQLASLQLEEDETMRVLVASTLALFSRRSSFSLS